MNTVDGDLAALAGAYRVATSYRGPHGRVDVDAAVVVAVLRALGVDASTPAATSAALAATRAATLAALLPPCVVAGPSGTIVLGAGPTGWPAGGAAEIEVIVAGQPVQVRALGARDVATPSGERIRGQVYRLPDGLPPGYGTVRVAVAGRRAQAPLIVPPRRLDPPFGTAASGDQGHAPRPGSGTGLPYGYGLMTQLYAMRSRDSWGLGDLHDLGELADAGGRTLGADFVLTNPLHATEPLAPISDSPYLAVGRRFNSPLYLRIEDIPEYRLLPAAEARKVAEFAAPLIASNSTADLLDRDAVWRAKRAALELIAAVPLAAEREAAFARFCAREEPALTDFATWCALAELHGPDWRRWPAELHDPRSTAVACARGELADKVRLHRWLQWLVDEQLAAAQSRARGAGMRIGTVHDLAVGAGGGGADGWLYQHLLVGDVNVGAPPDVFNQRGQDWGQPPWHPGRLAAAGFAPYRDLIRHALAHAGGLRVDHVMGQYRLWWVPRGSDPAAGTYVYYDHAAMVGVLMIEAAAAGAVLIGEDLGTVQPAVREDLAHRGVLGTSVLWFERDETGEPRPAEQWRAGCLATIDSHDLPTIPAYLSGEHVDLRARLGLLTGDADAERAAARDEVRAWIAVLRAAGLLAPDAGVPDEWQVTRAVHGYLARTPAKLIGISLPDMVGRRDPQNVPGTSTEYPNWRIPLLDGDGHPVLLEDLLTGPRLAELIAVIRVERAALAASGT